MELLESERKYVINLSLILKIKATLQGPDVKRSTKERRYLLSCALCLLGSCLQSMFLLHYRLRHFSSIYTEIFEHLGYFQLKTGGIGRFLQSLKMFLPVPCILSTIFILILGEINVK